MYVCMYVYVCMCVCVYVCMCVCVYVCMCIYIYCIILCYIMLYYVTLNHIYIYIYKTPIPTGPRPRAVGRLGPENL